MNWKSNARMGHQLEDGTIFESEYGVTIHRIVHISGWFLSCSRLNISEDRLQSDTFHGAVEESKQVIQAHLNDLLARFHPFSEDTSQNFFVRY